MKNCMLPIDFCIPDAEAHVMSDGKVYLYGSLDCAADRWCSDSYRVVSSSNLKEWKVSKPCFSVKDVPWAGKTDMRRQLHLDEVKSIDDLPENIRMFLPKAARLVPIKLLVNQIAKQLNADSLRLTNASLLIAQGVDVRTVASLLGHAQASTTLDIYAHAFDKNKRKAQEKLGKTIGL